MDRWVGQERVIDAIAQAIVVTDPAGRVQAWNRAAHALYGWSRAEAVGRVLDELIPSTLLGLSPCDRLDTLAAGASWSAPIHVRDRAGRTFPVLVTDTPIVDDAGAQVGVVRTCVEAATSHEVRERARAQVARQAAVAALAASALADPDVDALLDRAVRLVGGELSAPLCMVLELLPPGDELLVRAGVGWRRGVVGSAHVLSTEASPIGCALRSDAAITLPMTVSDDRVELLGEHGVVAGIGTAIRGRGTTFGVLSVHTTTPASFSGDDLAFVDTVAGVLGAAIAREEVESVLRGTVEELERSEDIRVAFLRATSHELRTPLSAVMGFASTLQRHDDVLDANQRADLLDRLAANAERLALLVADLLDVDRLASGLLQADRRPHDLRGLVSRVMDELDLMGRCVDVDLAEITADVDAPKFERVVANLVTNAVRHTPTGGHIRIGLERVGGAAMLSVEDDGNGIHPAYLDRIFEPFVQGPDRHHDAKPGAGLGLNLVRELVALHGGRAVASNLPEGGARFEIVLPDLEPVEGP